MRDAMPRPVSPDLDLRLSPDCCPGGACGPVFETSLVGLVFNRVRRFVDSRSAASVAELVGSAADPVLHQPMSTASADPVSSSHPQKDAPHD
jgi:hypothetical protein